MGQATVTQGLEVLPLDCSALEQQMTPEVWGAVPGWRPGQRPPERNDPPVTLGQGHMSHTFHEAQSKRWSPPKALEGARTCAHTHTHTHTNTSPLDEPLRPPRYSAGLRQCSAAIFRPHAALQPHPPSAVSPAGAAAPRGTGRQPVLQSLCLQSGGVLLREPWKDGFSPSAMTQDSKPAQAATTGPSALGERQCAQAPSGPGLPEVASCPAPCLGLRWDLGPQSREREGVSVRESSSRDLGGDSLPASVRFPESQEPLSLEEGLWVISVYVFVSLPFCFVVFLIFSFFFSLCLIGILHFSAVTK